MQKWQEKSSPICNFIFGSIRTCLPTDTVDIDLTISTVKGIYTYRKDCTVESMIFTLWSKKVIPFPSLRWKIQVFQDHKRQEMTIPWNDGKTLQFSAPPKMPRNLRKQTTGKIRIRWSGRNRFYLIKMRRPYTLDTKVSELDKVDIKAPILTKACDRFGLSCSYCEQGVPHPSPQESDLSSKDWDSTKAKAREQNDSLIDFNEPKPQAYIDQTTDIDKVAFSKLQIRKSNLKEEPIEVMNSLIPPPPPMTETPGDTTGNTNREKLSEAEKRLQKEEEKYDLYGRVYVGQLSKKVESDKHLDCSTYSYFT